MFPYSSTNTQQSRCRSCVWSGALCTSLAIFAVFAASASAARTYHSQITGFESPGGIAIDGHGNAWVGDTGNGLISEFGPFPSTTKVGELNGTAYYGTNVDSFGLNDSTGFIYVAERGNVDVDVFDSNENFSALWTTEDQGGHDALAVDNSESPTDGRIYVLRGGPHPIQARNANDEPDELSGSGQASYISGNYITGTPSGPIGDIENGATDSEGDLYIVDTENAVVDEYSSGGFFLRAFTGAGAPGGFTSYGLTGVGVDPTNGNVLIVDSASNVVDEFTSTGEYLDQLTGTASEPFGRLSGGIAVNPEGYAYVADAGDHAVDIYGPGTKKATITYHAVSDLSHGGGTLNATINPDGSGEVTTCYFEYGTSMSYGSGQIPCSPATNYLGATEVSTPISGLTAQLLYHYRVVVSSSNGTTRVGADQTYTPQAVNLVSTDAATSVEGTSAQLNGSFVGNGVDTHYYFEWGRSKSYGEKTAVPPGADAGAPSGPSRIPILFKLEGLEEVTTYHYRVVMTNMFGTTYGKDQSFTTTTAPPLVHDSVNHVHAESALLQAAINPGGTDTTYFFEWGTTAAYGNQSAMSPGIDIGAEGKEVDVSEQLTGLHPGTTYHYRVVASNSESPPGGTVSPDQTFETFPTFDVIADPCPNAHVRQQTGAALLLDCRAYELVSAANTGGYDVESDLVPGQAPYGGYPQASGATGNSRVLYGIHDGAIPEVAGDPTNKGVDPYVATRGNLGWSTDYVGIPSGVDKASGPFSSTLAEADPKLDTFAFAGPGICNPCFAKGIESGIPLHLPNGDLVQGMAGSEEPEPSAKPDGYIAKYFSDNGDHMIFGSVSHFSPGGGSSGDVSIYDRDLRTNETHIVSNAPDSEDAPAPLRCLQGEGKCNAEHHDSNGIAELAVSSNGSRILLGQKVSEDSDHNVYWHLYLNVDDSITSIDLTPGVLASPGETPLFAEGVLFDGMNASGSKVYFTTKDEFLPGDTDASPDIYLAEVGEASAKLQLVSVDTSGFSNSNSCVPVGNSNGAHWNTVGSAENCGAVAIGGGSGVAAEGKEFYFLSPEQLDGASHGTENQPNLYVANPGSPPRFIATLKPDDPVVLDAIKEHEIIRTANFQLTPSGRYAAFTTSQPLDTTFDNAGHLEVYRYDAVVAKLDCASCAPTNESATADSTLASDGSSLSDSGQVFFDSSSALAPRDLDQTEDVYEWEPEGIGNCSPESPLFVPATVDCVGLISTGTSPFASSLLGVSTDGTDVYFFTHDKLVPQDHNGELVKVYDARVEGGFPYTEPTVPCKASDECHGPGSAAPEPPSINSVTGSGGNHAPGPGSGCRSGYVKKHGRCVRKSKARRHPHHKPAIHKRGGAK